MPMKPDQTRRKIIFGRYMQSLRERCDPTPKPDELATELKIARTTITRMEGGYTVPSFLLARTLLEMYKATPAERAEVEQLRQAAKASMARIEHAADMVQQYSALRRDEADAERVRTLDTVIIPGFLQTADYAAELWRVGRRAIPSESDESVAAAERRDRQGLLTREQHPVQLHALIDEVALHRKIGGPAVVTAQLDHLLKVGNWPNVTIQVIPFELGAYGPTSGAMILLDFADSDMPGLAYLEYIGGGVTVENEGSVAKLSAMWDDIAAAAPSPRQSAKMIRAARDALAR